MPEMLRPDDVIDAAATAGATGRPIR